jgi:hypothetical protein
LPAGAFVNLSPPQQAVFRVTQPVKNANRVQKMKKRHFIKRYIGPGSGRLSRFRGKIFGRAAVLALLFPPIAVKLGVK